MEDQPITDDAEPLTWREVLRGLLTLRMKPTKKPDFPHDGLADLRKKLMEREEEK